MIEYTRPYKHIYSDGYVVRDWFRANDVGGVSDGIYLTFSSNVALTKFKQDFDL